MITWEHKDTHTLTHVTISTFKDGSVNVNINRGCQEPDASVERIWVVAKMSKPEHQLALMFTMAALRSAFPCAEFALDLPYLPYGRQDRVCNMGEAHNLKEFGKYINQMGFKAVVITDPHSAVAEGVIDNVQVVPQLEVFQDVHNFAEWIIVAPDLGALKKTEKFAEVVGARGVLAFHKSRNLQTGEILRHDLLNPAGLVLTPEDKLFVLDDICDGGRTFVGVAERLREYNPAKLELAVTHGIFSYGTEVVTSVYDKVHTTNSFNPLLTSQGKLNVIDI